MNPQRVFPDISSQALQIDDRSSILGAMNRPREYEDTREHLLAIGEAVIRSKGFAGVGLAEILAEAGVPKGSFYHYFRSKEGFGADMLARYFERHDLELKQFLQDAPGPARDRLLHFFRGWAERYTGGQLQCQQACLAVKLSAEVADMSEAMREVLAAGTGQLQRRLSLAISDGIEDGSLSPDLQPEALAGSLHLLWTGAELMTKVQRSPEPFRQALLQTGQWLQAPG